MTNDLYRHALELFLLAIPVACVSWTVTHEEIFREAREWCSRRSRSSRGWLGRKFYYVLTCEYCFSHYVSFVFLALTRFTLLRAGWPGYAIAGFSLVWVSNIYMSLFGRLRLDIKHERVEIAEEEQVLQSDKQHVRRPRRLDARG